MAGQFLPVSLVGLRQARAERAADWVFVRTVIKERAGSAPDAKHTKKSTKRKCCEFLANITNQNTYPKK